MIQLLIFETAVCIVKQMLKHNSKFLHKIEAEKELEELKGIIEKFLE